MSLILDGTNGLFGDVTGGDISGNFIIDSVNLQDGSVTQSKIAPILATGTTEARNLQDRFSDVVNVKDFGAVGDGVADDTAAIQAAINYAGGISNNPTSVYIPSTQNGYRVTSTLNISSGRIYLYGDGFATPGVLTTSKSSELFFDHTGIGIQIYQVSGTTIDGISTRRNQPTPTSGWIPNVLNFDISVIAANDTTIQNCLIRNATKGIKGYSIGFGRLNLFNIKMQAFDVGIEIDEMYDVARLHDIHIWPFWSADSNVTQYTKSNLIGINSLRNDNPNLSNIFTWGAKYGIRCGNGTSGAPFTSRALIVNAGFDNVGNNGAGLFIDANLTSVQIENSYSFDGLNGIYIAANNTRLTVSNFRTSANKGSGINVGGSGNKVQLSTITIDGFNTDNTAGATAILAVSNNEVFVDGKIIASTTSGESPVNSYASIESDEWFDFVPTVFSETGFITSYTSSGKVRRQGRTLRYYYTITITNAGTGAGFLAVNMPYACLYNHITNGREETFSETLNGILPTGSTQLIVRKYNATSVVATGKIIQLNGEYIIQ